MESGASFERVLTPLLRSLPPNAAQQLARFQADDELQRRIEELAHRANEGELTADERREYEAYVDAGDIIAKTLARRVPTPQPADGSNQSSGDMPRHFLRELNEPAGFWKKLGIFLFLLLCGALVAPLFWLALQMVRGPAWRSVIVVGIEVIAAFYVTLLVYVLWRPLFLQRLYAQAELKLVVLGYILGYGVLALMLVAAVYVIVQSIQGG